MSYGQDMKFARGSIREERHSMVEAQEVRLLCPHCSGALYVPLEWPYLRVERQRRINAAIEEHRRLCEGAPPEAARVYRIDYPRAT